LDPRGNEKPPDFEPGTTSKAGAGEGRRTAYRRYPFSAGVRVVVPEIADYEDRRELVRANRVQGIARLDALALAIGYLPVDPATLRRAADLWATARQTGIQTAGDQAFDCDVILSAQAQLATEDGYDVTVATDNVDHLARFVDARTWSQITS
jgi:hypothetical protein